MLKLMTRILSIHRKITNNSKYVNLYTLIFIYHTLIMDYTGGTLLMCFSTLRIMVNIILVYLLCWLRS